MRVVIYSRVSSADQTEGYSLEAQKRAIRQTCEIHGYEIVAEYCDEGKSAVYDSLDKRPAFRQAVAAVTSGQADCLMVHKLDRAARSLRLLLDVLATLDNRIVSVVENLDTATPQGLMFVHILGVLAQYYSNNLSQEVKKGKSERRRQGLWNGKLPFGLRKQDGDEAGRLPPVADDTPVLCTLADRREWSRYDALVHLFQLSAAGTSLPTIVHELRELGFVLGLGTVWDCLNNRTYLGEVPVGERVKGKRRVHGWLPGAHQGVIDPALFEKAAKAREANRTGPANIGRRYDTYPLSGLARCARCGGPMHCRKHGRPPKPAIYCWQRFSARTCDQPCTLMAPIEEQAIQFLRQYRPPMDLAAWLAEQVKGQGADTKRERTNLERRLRKLRDLYLWGDMAQDEYLREKQALEAQMARLAPIKSDRRLIERTIAYWQDLPSAYADALPAERNALLRGIFTQLEVDGNRLVRVGFQPLFDRLMRASADEVFGQSGLAENVYSHDSGLWMVPALEFVAKAKPYIPQSAWPQLVEEYRAGVPMAALTETWGVSATTIYRALKKSGLEWRR